MSMIKKYKCLYLYISLFIFSVMARLPLNTRYRRTNVATRNIMTTVMLLYYHVWLIFALAYRRKCLKIERRIRIKELRFQNLYELIRESDTMCISQLRMDRRTFGILCEMVRDVGGLEGSRNMSLEEIVASFLYILSHHFKNRTVDAAIIFATSPEKMQMMLALPENLRREYVLKMLKN